MKWWNVNLQNVKIMSGDDRTDIGFAVKFLMMISY